MDRLSWFSTEEHVGCHQNATDTTNFRSTPPSWRVGINVAFALLGKRRASVFGCSVFGAGCNLSIPENAHWFADSRAIAGKVQPALIFFGSYEGRIPPRWVRLARWAGPGGARRAAPARAAFQQREPFVHQPCTLGASKCFPSAKRGRGRRSAPCPTSAGPAGQPYLTTRCINP